MTYNASTVMVDAFFSRSLAEADPEIFGAIAQGTRPPAARDRADRVGEHRFPRRARSAGLVHDQQICRGLSGQALLRRLPVCRYRRGTGDRARQEAVRRRFRQRPAQFRLPDEPGGVPGAAAARRHVHGPRPQLGRAPDARLAGQHVAASGSTSSPTACAQDDHLLDMEQIERKARAQAETDHRRRHGLFPHLGLEALPRDRRFGRRLSDGRHGPHRRPGCRRRASVAVPACACRRRPRRTRRCAGRAAA